MNHIQKPRYKHLLQKKSFCSATCVQMALLRRNVWVDQELLAQEIGIRISEEDAPLYVKKFDTLPKDDENIGFRLEEFEEKRTKEVLKTLYLKPKVHKYSEVENVEEFLIGHIDHGRDVILNIWWEPLTKRKHGHFVLVSEYDDEKKELLVCDPHYASKNEWTMSLEDLKESMDKKWDGNERGFAVLSYTKK